MSGVMIILFVLVVNLLNAFIISGSTATTQLEGCTSSNNVTTCESQGKESFFDSLFGATFMPFDGAPVILNAVWAMVMLTLLSTGVLLIVLSFIPFTAE